MSQEFRILSEDEVKGLFSSVDGLTAVEDAYRDFARSPEIQSRPSAMSLTEVTGHLGEPKLGPFAVKGAIVPSQGAAGALLYALDNPYIYLWGAGNNAPIGMIACDWLSKRRVALTVTVAIRALARPDVRKIVLFGAGRWARQTCEVVARHWNEAEIAVVARRPQNAAAFAAAMPSNVIPAEDGRDAVRSADAVVTLTNASESFIHSGWLDPGALLLSMGSPHEVDIEVLRECDAFLVDDLSYARQQGDVSAWLSRGEVDDAELGLRLRAGIGEVIAGTKAGRMNDNERLLVVLQGLTACDVALAKAVLDRAQIDGMGQIATI